MNQYWHVKHTDSCCEVIKINSVNDAHETKDAKGAFTYALNQYFFKPSPPLEIWDMGVLMMMMMMSLQTSDLNM